MVLNKLKYTTNLKLDYSGGSVCQPDQSSGAWEQKPWDGARDGARDDARDDASAHVTGL